MTAIVAYKDAECIYYGSDSRVTFDSGPVYDTNNKWRMMSGRTSKTPILVGCAGSARLDNIIVSSAKNFESAESIFEIADHVKKSIALDGWKEEKDEGGEPPSYSIDLLVIFEKGLYRISSDLSVTEIQDFQFVAVGSGEPYCLGAAYGSKSKKPKEIIKVALSAAIKFDPNCGGRLFIGTIDR
jgi:ATP-dependent protease HslVU (ClpYQ) peptidase subunit